MDPGVMVPLAVFAMVVVIVGLVNFGSVRNREIATHQFLSSAEAEHLRLMADLERELRRVQQAG
jgi:hypothetical protein